jgi:mono/diheme cytochrome c family protein
MPFHGPAGVLQAARCAISLARSFNGITMLQGLRLKLALTMALGAVAGAAHAADDTHAQWGQVERFCFGCHNSSDWAGGVAFDGMSFDNLGQDAKVWETAVRKLRTGSMPPPGAKQRPDQQTVNSLAGFLETRLDAAQVAPAPGRVPLRRLNQREYANAVRDLLGLDVDIAALLPGDRRKDAFDNDAQSLQVSPSYLDQYLGAARKVAQQAIGNRNARAVSTTYGQLNDMVIALAAEGLDGAGSQLLYKEGMPFGTRGGISFEHDFPAAGEYALTIGDLASGRQIPRMEFSNTVIALLDGKEFYRTQVGGERDQKGIDQWQEKSVDEINARLRDIRFHAPAGQHTIAVTFLKRANIESEERFPSDPPEGGEVRQAFLSALRVRGPLKVDLEQDSVSRQKIFAACYPTLISEEIDCARQNIAQLARRAFRRPVNDALLQPLMAFYDEGFQAGGFEGGVRNALTAILASPYFLYRVEGGDGATTHTLTDVELASRLSFFIWGSIPDDALLTAAVRGELHQPAQLQAQVRRMLADARAKSLSTDFGFQWLNLAKMDEIEADARLFRNATGTLDARPLLKREMELFLDSVLRSDQPVTAVLTADYTYLNETLAMLYGIGSVKGGQFRRVTLADSKRHGLLGKGAVLMATAYPNRTSPVLRGSWILDRILGMPPYQAPPNVGILKENARGTPATLRERLELHTKNPSCFACHGVMDPLGFALENFDTIGQYRVRDADTGGTIDTAGTLPDGTKLTGPDDLRQALMAHPERFVQTLAEQLMSYALGRPVDYRDMPVVRQIVRNAAQDNYRFASLVSQIVSSDAFRRREPAAAPMKMSAVGAVPDPATAGAP